MKPVFGIANSNVVDIALALKKLRPRTKVCVLGLDDNSQLDDAKIVVSTVANLIHKKSLIKKLDPCIFVVDAPINLVRIRKIQLVDCRLDYKLGAKMYSISSSILEDCLQQAQRGQHKYKTLKVKPMNAQDILLSRTPTSIMPRLMALLYSIPDKRKRELYKTTIFKWIVNPELSTEYLRKELHLNNGKKGKALIEFLTSDTIGIVRSLFVDGANVRSILRKNKLSKFDFMYFQRFQKQPNKVVINRKRRMK